MVISSKNILQEFCHTHNLSYPIYETWRDCNDNKWYSLAQLNIYENHTIFEETPYGSVRKKEAEQEVAKKILEKANKILLKKNSQNSYIFSKVVFIDLETHKDMIDKIEDDILYIGIINKHMNNFKRKYKKLINKENWVKTNNLNFANTNYNKLLYVLTEKRDNFNTSYFISTLLHQLISYRKSDTLVIDFHCYGSSYLYDTVYNLINY